MRADIKERIEQVSLDFPADWDTGKLKNLVTPLTGKAGDDEYEILSITAGKGFVRQADKFGRNIAGKQYENYIILKKGDFSYNKGNSKTYPQGCVYMLEDCDEAVAPNVFNSFRFKHGSVPAFYKQLFISGYLNHQLYRLINSGVRNDGLLNLYDEDFYSCIVPVPSVDEQHKIAEILTQCDKVIDLKKQLVEEKRRRKKWLMQKLLSVNNTKKLSKIKDVAALISGQDFPESKLSAEMRGIPYLTGASNIVGDKIILNRWTEHAKNIAKAGDILLVCKGAGVGKTAILHEDTVHIARQFMAIRTNEKIAKMYCYYIINHYCTEIKKMSKGLIEGIDRKTVLNLEIYLPSIETQITIANILSAADREIDLLEQELEQWKTKKKSLMQLLLTGLVRVRV